MHCRVFLVPLLGDIIADYCPHPGAYCLLTEQLCPCPYIRRLGLTVSDKIQLKLQSDHGRESWHANNSRNHM